MIVFVKFLQLVFFLRGVLPSKWHDWLRINLADYHFKPFAIDWYQYLVFEQSLFSNAHARPLHKKVHISRCTCKIGEYIWRFLQKQIGFSIQRNENSWIGICMPSTTDIPGKQTTVLYKSVGANHVCMRRWRRRLVDIWSFLTKFLTFQDQGYLSRFKIPTKKRGLFFRFWENSLCCRLLFFLFSCFP